MSEEPGEPRSLSYEEAQRQHRCPYCGAIGERFHDPVLDLDKDFDAYRCPQQHVFFVHKQFSQEP